MTNALAVKQSKRKKLHSVLISQGLLIFVLLILGIIMILPFYWSIITSFTSKQYFGTGLHFKVLGFTLDNWKSLFKQNWAIYIYNTLFIAAMEIALQLLFCSMGAYVMAKFNFKGKKTLYRIMLLSMMMPGIITLIPQFIVIINFPINQNGGEIGPGLYNTLWAVIMPNAVSIYGILFLKQFFVNLSDDIGDAARVDGANEFKIFSIYFKMAIPGITTLGLFTFVSTWNSYLWPSMVLFSENKFTLGVAITEFQTKANTGEMMAASLISILPIIVLFAFTQKYFMKQISYTGVK